MGAMIIIEVVNVVTWVVSDFMQGSHKEVMSRKRGHQSVFISSHRGRQSVFTIGLQGRQNVITICRHGHTKVVKGNHTSQKIAEVVTCGQFGLPKTSIACLAG
jgi:hypothetical protein